MNWMLAIAISAILLVMGCHHDANESTSLNELPATKSSGDGVRTELPSDENPFGGDLEEDTRRSETPPGDAIPEEWNEWLKLTRESETEYAPTVDFQTGNLVPCPDGLAEFVLEIKAMSAGKCFYQWRQSFCRYDESKPDPSHERGMPIFPENVSVLLNNGFAGGTYQYLGLANETVTVKIDFDVSLGEDAQDFAAEMTATCSKSGKVDAGNGNSLEWSFNPSP